MTILLPALHPVQVLELHLRLFMRRMFGADKILAMGGQRRGRNDIWPFGLPKANILVGPGNQFVAEAKRMLFGRVGIDMIAGPTDSLILADGTADADIVAADLVGQAEHGYNSPVWLVTDDRALAEKVMVWFRALLRIARRNRDNAPHGVITQESWSTIHARKWLRHQMPMPRNI